MKTDNTTAMAIANDTCKLRRSKAMDMRYHWIRDRVTQSQFNVYWADKKNNKADYFTKHFPPSHHRLMRPFYLHMPDQSVVRGRVDPAVTGIHDSTDVAVPVIGIHDSTDMAVPCANSLVFSSGFPSHNPKALAFLSGFLPGAVLEQTIS
jgi:hypothetical protein